MRAKSSTCALLLALCQPFAAVAALPEAGMSMKAVEAQFGQPLRKDAPVGTPPITRWEYSDSVVVFERSTVVHSMNVQRSGSPAPAVPAAKPAPAPVPAAKPAPAPAAKPVAPAAPVAAPATAAPATPAPVVPASTEAAPAPASREAAEADAMSKAAAEKSAAGSTTTGEATTGAAPGTAAPANETYTFDPETGRIIVK
ncbi:MAG: hypothetical protein K0Q68_1675 [Moraxellaceae bacterium]|jgi:outer membrane biosynthesis protein TonB|nr:hypothetical protein [Moraxellaceae bacterium]